MEKGGGGILIGNGTHTRQNTNAQNVEWGMWVPRMRSWRLVKAMGKEAVGEKNAFFKSAVIWRT